MAKSKQSKAAEPELDDNDLPIEGDQKKPEEDAAAKKAAADAAGAADGTDKVPDDDEGADEAKPGEDDPAELKKQLREARKKAEAEASARLKAEQERDDERKKRSAEGARAETAEQAALKQYEDRLVNDEKSVTERITDIKKKQKAALDAGDNETLVELNEQLADAKLDIRAIAGAKSQLATWKEQQKNKPETPADADKPKVSAKTQAWIDEHPRFNTDTEFFNDAIAAHEIFKAKNPDKIDTDEYFAFVNKRLKKSYPEEFEDDDTPPANGHDKKAKGKQEETADEQDELPASSSAAPPSREGGSTGGGKTPAGKVRLTAAELEAAEICGMTAAEYAQEKYGKPIA